MSRWIDLHELRLYWSVSYVRAREEAGRVAGVSGVRLAVRKDLARQDMEARPWKWGVEPHGPKRPNVQKHHRVTDPETGEVRTEPVG